MASHEKSDDLGVFGLLSELCTKTACKYSSQRVSQKKLASKMRSVSYEIILRKSSTDSVPSASEPTADLISYYYTNQVSVKNVAEYKRATELKHMLSKLNMLYLGCEKDTFFCVLKFLIALKDSVKEDLSSEMYKNPFSFGMFDRMLPKPHREPFGSPQPYSYYPPHVFELPFSLKKQAQFLDKHKSKTYSEYTVETFDSNIFLPKTAEAQGVEIKTFHSPMSLASMMSSHLSPYSEPNFLHYPKLTGPRDLKIPKSESCNMKISLANTEVRTDMHEVFEAQPMGQLDIWELASQLDRGVPENIWEAVSKMPLIEERQLIATSSREMLLWREIYGDMLSQYSVISERQFIRHIMYLILGIETSSFKFDEESNCFTIKENLILEGISPETLKGYTFNLLLVGKYYRRLYEFAFDRAFNEDFHSNGLIYEAAREVIRSFLLDFRIKATEIFKECFKSKNEEFNLMPTLLQILYHMEPLKQEIETVAVIYKIVGPRHLPQGADLMSYLYSEISLVTHKQTAHTMFNALYSVCKVYFKFIERFIFEGELDDIYDEFFIRKDPEYVNSRSKRYWDKGFHLGQTVGIPEFLRSMVKLILLCGKSLRLLKLCNSSDPLVLLISSHHPSVKCCTNFDELERQLEVLDVYRTRCLFVSGELVTFDQILLKKEAESKAFAEMASVKQAETLEKIVAERKRLAQLILAEKQHSLRVLQQAMAETEAAKYGKKRRDKRITQLERELDTATEEVDSRIRDDERNKIMEYYSKLNIEVEKGQIHTEWKIKRLQLSESRMQLLSSEERNLKREKLEVEHQEKLEAEHQEKKKEEVMAMSIQSLDRKSEEELDNKVTNNQNAPIVDTAESSKLQEKDKTNTDVFSAICNAAKSIFGVSKDKDCDNKKDRDSQGNIIAEEVNSNEHESKTSSDVIGGNLSKVDNINFVQMRQDALSNKEKNMSHILGKTDEQNNKLKDVVDTVDDENNLMEGLPFMEAKRNKLKVLSAEFDVIQPKEVKIVKLVPKTDAQKEALINKHKVLGVEYNLPLERHLRKPANEAQEEALVNKRKVLGDDFHLPAEKYITKYPNTDAQEEALVNKRKVMGVEFNLPAEEYVEKDPITEAQEEALCNRKKGLGVDFNLPAEKYAVKNPITEAQEEAVCNRRKGLGVDFNLPAEKYVEKDPITEAQEEAVCNRRKGLGVYFNLPAEKYAEKDPITDAQIEAVRNRQRSTSSDSLLTNQKREALKRSGLTLNLKPFSETSVGTYTLDFSPNTGTSSPGEYFPRLDIETPTTADISLEGESSELSTAYSECSKENTTVLTNSDKDFVNKGFDYSIIDVDEPITEHTSDLNTNASPETSPSKKLEPYDLKLKQSIFNLLDGTYSLKDFDPFGMKNLNKFPHKNQMSSKMDYEMSLSCYTHPAIIMEEVKKSPRRNIFNSLRGEVEEKKIICDSIASLSACLKRSVFLPLTYQLEVVNNAILTHYLVNMDMYEHLKSLKDYFFLMDGEFARSICKNLFTKLSKTLNPQELLNFATLHNILDKALGSSISHVHKFSENLSFTITDAPLSFHHSSPDVLHCLSLTYTIGWPLNIILSQEALVRYAKVFQFLIKMRRISWVLGEDFENLKLRIKMSPEPRNLLHSPHYISIQIYRHTMASLIRALDNYIVTTCILTSWKEFENDLKKARTLDDLYDCHAAYIKKVLFRCLLNNRSTPVMKLLNDIFTVILKFSRVLKAGEWQRNEQCSTFRHSNYHQLEELFYLFKKLAKYLHKVISRLMECGYQRHLVELLSIVNYNGFYDFEKGKEEHNTTVQSP